MGLTEKQLLARLQDLEDRIARLEGETDTEQDIGDFTFTEEPSPVPFAKPFKPAVKRQRDPIPATQILGWTGILALVLAAAYLIKLGIDLGWLTPARQIIMAFIGGIGLVGAGLALRQNDREYASLLPAGGVVILFLTTYGAHLYYRLIPFSVAVGAISLICLLSLWLCYHFSSEIYAYFATIGSYTAPLLLPGLRAVVTDLAIYYTAWSLLYCACAIWLRKRHIYLVAAYLALLGFDLIWYQQWSRMSNPHWEAAIIFQAVQFIIFAGCTALFTLKHDDRLDRSTAIGHLPPLLIFYALEYNLLDRYLHSYAPWIALASLLALLLIYLAARYGFRQPLEGGQLILSTYAAIVLFHALYLELLPDILAPWAGLAAGLILAAWLFTKGEPDKANWPLIGAFGLIFIINALRSMLNYDLQDVTGGDYLALAFAAELYAAYFFLRRVDLPEQFKGGLLYVGHFSAMAAPVNIFDDRLPVSLTWALLAILALIIAIKIRDRLLAQSSLFIFAVSGAKVLLYDLDNAAPLIRIGCLVILGISFYIGGWLYRKTGDLES
ncbi:MAG: hypothetical protein C0615_03105 [Desulfuromonas sp.]|nr:MAG: hypothetical protein C0615_03105 [Desulfuromonas sp.]